MAIPTLQQLFKSGLLPAGLIFIGLNLTESYIFYHINSYKIFLMGVGVSLMAIYNDLFFTGRLDTKIPWKVLCIIAIPLIATIPGFIYYQGNYNYNFRYELATNLILIVWVSYLYRGVEKKEDLSPFIFLIGITIAYVSIWAILEKIGYHPLFWDTLPTQRVQATFGHMNYLAGFLIVLLPLFQAFFK